jgi:hypothetical protein
MRDRRFRITLTPKMRLYFTQLLKTGLYGKDLSEVATRLLAARILDLLGEGVLKLREKK